MKFLSPTESKRLNEVLGFVFLAFGLLVLFSLISYQTYDPSWNTATGGARPPQNLAGYVGSYLSDLLLQTFGLAALLIPAGVFTLGWKWIRSDTIVDPGVKLSGFLMLGSSVCAVLGEGPEFHVFGLPASGLVGMLLAHALIAALNRAGAVLVTLDGHGGFRLPGFDFHAFDAARMAGCSAGLAAGSPRRHPGMDGGTPQAQDRTAARESASESRGACGGASREAPTRRSDRVGTRAVADGRGAGRANARAARAGLRDRRHSDMPARRACRSSRHEAIRADAQFPSGTYRRISACRRPIF